MSMGWDDEGNQYAVPQDSRIITSDDVFDYMLTMRTENDEITDAKAEVKAEYAALKYGDNIRFNGMENYDEFRLQVMSRRKSVSRRKFIRRMAGQ